MQLCRRLAAVVGLVSAALLSLYAGADVSTLDAGELGGAAVALGVPHPSGFSLDMLLLRAATLWPLGSLAFRQNICVGLLTAAAINCVAYASMRLARQCDWGSPPAAAAAASVSATVLLSSRTILDAALAVEVYASAWLCVAIAGLLADAADKAPRRAVWPLYGLALGAHITAPLLLAPIALDGWLRGTGRSRPAMFAMVVGFACSALVISYLPLASLRDTAFDWGDPETFGRWLRHLSAARIREAYGGALFTQDTLPRLHLIEQLGERPFLLLPAAIGVLGVLREQPQRLLAIGALLSLDLAYAIWINPMGVAQRQVGHASIALLALLAGCGGALVVELLRGRLRYAAQLTAALTAGACVWVAGHAVSQGSASDGYAVSERYGAASPLSELPARSVYVCESDTACATGLFSVYAEGTRPDLDVVPAQHLWDPTILRRLRGLPLAAASDRDAWPEPEQRGALARRRRRALFLQTHLRPLFFERSEHLTDRWLAQQLDLSHLPWVGLSASAPAERRDDSISARAERADAAPRRESFGARDDGASARAEPTEAASQPDASAPQRDASASQLDASASQLDASASQLDASAPRDGTASARAESVDATASRAASGSRNASGARAERASGELARLERARFGAVGPGTPLARELWASAHETLGSVYLRSGDGDRAVAEYARAVELTPLRAAARSNLGVALEQRGDLPAALAQTARAVELDPLRPTPWVNLTRLLLRVQGREAARAALLNASRLAVQDPRLDELDRELDDQQ
jgi:Flp pilus assembly protein TadD